jgi:peptide/nickel transport system substrate-binding protein
MHHYIPELKEKYRKGQISRREFLRTSALLGFSLSSSGAFLAGFSPDIDNLAQKSARRAFQSEPTRGGELIVGTGPTTLQRLTDPSQASWTEFNLYRNVAEYLTVTDQENITEPWLLESWEPNDDLTEWTLVLRQGIKFNTGSDLTADDVVFNFERWLNPDTGTSMTGLLSGYLSSTGIEKVDDYTIKLHLDAPQIGVPEHLFHYPAVILPKDFEGEWYDNPAGTGPFTLDEFFVEERAVLKARSDYWRSGADGSPLPYLDSIRLVNLGTDPAPFVAALTTGEIHMGAVTPPVLDALAGFPEITVASQTSSYTHVIRMRCDVAPFDNPKVRNAIKACQDRAAMLEATMRGYGALGEDFHVAPIHPEYQNIGGPPARDIDKAKALLAEAGYPDGLDITLASIDADPNVTMAQLLKQQCEPAGINITLNLMPSSLYWDQWMDVDFGITSWTHRPLATMVLGLAYRSTGPWNETHWANEEFDALLSECEGTYEIEARRELMGRMEVLMQEDGGAAIPRWGSFLTGLRPEVHNFRQAPSDHLFLYDVWLEGEA